MPYCDQGLNTAKLTHIMLNVKCERLKCVTGRKTNLEISMATGKKKKNRLRANHKPCRRIQSDMLQNGKYHIEHVQYNERN